MPGCSVSPRLTMPADILARVGAALYGPRWQTDLARELGVADRTVRRWVAGADRPRPGVWADLRRALEERRADLTELLAELPTL